MGEINQKSEKIWFRKSKESFRKTMKIIAKVRYVDHQKRSHYIEIESDSADRRHM